ncbi:MAG: hypothetical protein R3F43_01140 [bacterium]
MPRVLIESPIDGQTFFDAPPMLSGQVLSLVAGGRVTREVDGAQPGTALATDADGRFSHPLGAGPWVAPPDGHRRAGPTGPRRPSPSAWTSACRCGAGSSRRAGGRTGSWP